MTEHGFLVVDLDHVDDDPATKYANAIRTLDSAQLTTTEKYNRLLKLADTATTR